VLGLGRITAVSPLKVYARSASGSGSGNQGQQDGDYDDNAHLLHGDAYVSGTITTTHNGPQDVQVKLSSAVKDLIYARVPSGVYVLLNATTWVTIASGPGAKSTVYPVDYLIVWAKSTPRSQQNAVSIPVTYRVMP
jgi:hypothetical protein